MKKLLHTTLTLLLCLAVKVNAQNYSPIVDGNTSLFLDNSNYIAALHVDSSTSDSKGMAYHFLKTWQPGSDCIDYHRATWAGPKCVKNNDTYYFFNENLDTIYFYPTKEVNDRWVFYKYANGDYVEATVTSKEQQTFLGLTDSVKTVSLQCKNAGGTNIPNTLIATTLTFSKSYGFIKPFSFLYFPNLQPDANAHYQLTLAGLTSPQAGIQLIRSNDIFNYDIGDVFHYDSIKTGSGYRFEKRICKILEKSFSINTDTVIYKIARTSEITTSNSSYNQRDTILEKHILNEPLYYPEQAIPLTDSSLFMERKPFPLYKISQSNEYNNRLILEPSYYYPYYYPFNGDTECWYDLIPEFGNPTYTYVKGLGLIFYDANPSPNGMGSEAGIYQEFINLVYYKKGDETWGTPLTLSTYSKVSNSNASLFPNPLKQGEQLHYTSDHFNITQVSVLNSMGMSVLIPSFTSSSIDLSSLTPGLYIIQLINDKNEYVSNKLIIK